MKIGILKNSYKKLMKEQDNHEQAGYWHDDREIGRVHLWGETYELFLRSHTSSRVYEPTRRTELVPVTATGRCTTMVGQVYIVEPHVSSLDHWRRLTKQPLPGRPRELDTVRVGDLEAAAYDRDHTIVLWDCRFLPAYQEAEPALDPNLRALWQGTEAELTRRFPSATRLVTPAWQPSYAPAEYREFLWNAGYTRLNRFAFGKTIQAAGDSARQHRP